MANTSRKTSELPNHKTMTLQSFFDFVDPDESLPADRDKTTTLQLLAEILVEIIGTGTIDGVLFTEDFVVQLTNGKSFGKYLNGQTVPAAGKTAKEVILMAAIEYLAPAFSSLTNASLIKTFEVGEPLPSGSQAVDYIISNFSTVKTQPPAVGVPSTNIAGATFPTNPFTLDASGAFNISIPVGFKLSAPGSRTITLTGTNSLDATFSITASIPWYYKQFYGPVATAANNSATVRALPSNRYTNAAGVFTLNTGSTHKVFQLWLPTGQTLSNVTDLDALNANLTSQYVASSLNVNDANGDAATGTLYTMTQAVAYSTSHRHQLTIT